MLRRITSMFSLLNGNEKICRAGGENLFDFLTETPVCPQQYEQGDLEFLLGYFGGGFDISAFGETARNLFELSPNALDALIHAWISELPIEAETAAFGRKVIAAAAGSDTEVRRQAAERAVSDRGCEDTLAVMAAAYKVQREVHRMMGLLRFLPNGDGSFFARCEPDHLVLPALGAYFTARFGETSWAVIDEKRNLCLSRKPGEQTKIAILEENSVWADIQTADKWENLWKHYHKTINNETRNNPNLQRRFMPSRYQKYLPETL